MYGALWQTRPRCSLLRKLNFSKALFSEGFIFVYICSKRRLFYNKNKRSLQDATKTINNFQGAILLLYLIFFSTLRFTLKCDRSWEFVL